MDLDLKNKVAVVLAASSGIGRGIATVLAQEGCNLAICARDQRRLEMAANEIRDVGAQVMAVVADVASASSLDAFYDQVIDGYGKIDILINNAGGPPAGKSLELSEEYYAAAYQLTLMSVVRSCRRVVPLMQKQRWGRIINIESTSIKCALDNMVLSNVFRSAVAAFAKTLSTEYARDGIRVHTLMSGPFNTQRMQELGTTAARLKGISFEQWKTEAEEGTSVGRFGDPLEFGALTAFLASDKAEYMNGTCIAIDGGALKTIS
jgi:3-oxoacyl-[acyl-carrier protein] reductase